MTADEIKAGVKLLNPGGYEVDGLVVEVKGGKALVAYDDGRQSEWIGVKHLTRKIGRPAGAGVRVPLAPRTVGIERRFAEVLKREMARQNLTWEALAERSGVSRATIARILADNACGATDTVEALAGALGIAPGKFWEVTATT
jgi:ribosome-binding protein aMBF1 (putative translation factor)